MDFFITLISSITIFILGLLVIARSYRSKQNKIFAFLAFSNIFWILANYFSTVNPTNLFLTRLVYFAGVLTAFSLLYFLTSFPHSTRPQFEETMIGKVYIASGIVMATITFLPGFISSVNEHEIFTGPLYFTFFIFIGASLVLLVRMLYLQHHNNLDREEKEQLKIVSTGIIIYALLAIISNVILPYITEDWLSSRLGPLFSLFLVWVISYSIIKHKLFDIRTVVARSAVYILTSGFILICYVATFFALKRVLFPSLNVTNEQLFASVLLTAILVYTFPYFKVRFNKITNKLFFRDSYDPQELIDKLNQVLVTSTELEVLLSKCASIIQTQLKIQYATFYIRETAYFKPRIIGSRTSGEFAGMDKIQELSTKMSRKIISSETLSSESNEKKLINLLRHNDVEVMARLTNTVEIEYEVKGIGFVFLGSKKSGSPYTGIDLKVLEIVANELVIAIENILRFEEIEQFNVTLQGKIDDATHKLKTTNEKLLALDEAKDEFVSMASHQLRTPLTSIKGYISMVLEGDAGKINDTQKQMLGQALFSSQRMVYLISDLLNVSRLKTGKFIIEPKPVYLPDLVESELSQLYEGAGAKNIKLMYDKPKHFATLNLDDMKIRQVVMNFTDNAIYYTPSGGKITVELKDKKDSVEFTVKDTGIGVPKSQQHKLFAKFYRADNARKARPDGTGLGIFMAKKVIIAQGGSLIFSSKEGKGSTFGFSFPKDKLKVDPNAPPPAPTEVEAK